MAPKIFLKSTFATIILFIISCANGMIRKGNLWFPEGFLIGAGSSAYQIEGGWDADGKGMSAWDHFTHTYPEKIINKSNGDVACDSYNKYVDDAKALKSIGMNYYRFSLSWSRILPKGFSNEVNQKGVKYYHNLISELEKRNITPMVTLFHWDHPQVFQEMGGWTNELMVDQFADYARVVFKEFGHRVKTWITINEPDAICIYAHIHASMPPGVRLGTYATYHCNQNVLKAHARVYQLYKNEFKAKQNGKVGIAIGLKNFFPKNEGDAETVDTAFQFQFGIYAHPIFSKTGDWPDVVKKKVAAASKKAGLPRSKLPEFSQYWIDYIRGSADFLGVNHYTSMLVEPTKPSNPRQTDPGVTATFDPSWPSTTYAWMKIVPHGFLNALLFVKQEYDNPLVYITENGVADHGTLDDNVRLRYLRDYMKNMLIAINDHKCNIERYTVWSLTDNFEWSYGYSQKFGLYHVDFNSPNKTRTPKNSVRWLRDVIRAKKLLQIDNYLVPNVPEPPTCDGQLELCPMGAIQLAPPIVDICYCD